MSGSSRGHFFPAGPRTAVAADLLTGGSQEQGAGSSGEKQLVLGLPRAASDCAPSRCTALNSAISGSILP